MFSWSQPPGRSRAACVPPRRLQSRAGVGVACAAALLAVALSAAGATPETAGLVVLDVRPGLAAHAAGVQPGDRLLRWERDGASGPLQSPFDLMLAELEQAPRGPVSLGLRRGEAPLRLTLPHDEWGLEAGPVLPADTFEAYSAARGLTQAGDKARAAAALEALAAAPGLQPEARWWLLAERARAQAEAREPRAARSTLEAAVREATPPAVQARLWALLGATFRRTRELAASEAAWAEALALQPAQAGGLARLADVEQWAWVRHQIGTRRAETEAELDRALAAAEREAPRSLLLGRLLDQRGRMAPQDVAYPALLRALALKEHAAPDSLALAETLHVLSYRGVAAGDKLAHARRSLTIRRRWAPGSSLEAASHQLVSMALATEGDLAGAAAHDRESLAIRERLDAGTFALSNALVNAAINVMERGDLEEAEGLYRRALVIEAAVRPGSIHHAVVLFNLGALLRRRHDFEGADDAYARAQRLAQEQSPDGNLLPRIVMSRGAMAAERGDLGGAEEQLREAVKLLGAAAPVTLGGAQDELARVLARRGKNAEAEALLRATLTASGDNRPLAASLRAGLGDLLARRGDLAAAEEQLRTALAVQREIAPGTVRHAESSHALGLVLGRLGRRAEALDLLRKAVAAIEEQGSRLGGSVEARARFRSEFQRLYRSLEEALLQSGQPQEAFEAVERSRARSLLAALASRDLDFTRDVPAPLEAERRRVDVEHDRALARLQDSSLDDAGRANARELLGQARRRQEDVRARIRAAAPRLAALRDPEPLGLAGVRRVLPPDTLLLVYSLGAETSRVYALAPGAAALQVASIPASADQIREQVSGLRELVARRRSPQLQGATRVAAGRLGELLLGPVARLRAPGQRLLIVPDGALHVLPFAALGDPSRPGRYLVESTAVSRVSSLTLFASLAAPAGDARAAGGVVGFADPLYPATGRGSAGTAVRDVVRGAGLEPLPWTRDEVRALASVAPGSARLYLGRDATEGRARQLPSDARLIHFACHGLLDADFPFESALALSPPATPGNGENGLLQAWEILEAVRLDADLVTLSACETGLGAELAGEGLLGLAWAFQYAGARSVAASLWAVSDAATAELMRAFYGHLAAGVSKAEALRRAQLHVLKRPATSAPWFWAAFTLIGDGR